MHSLIFTNRIANLILYAAYAAWLAPEFFYAVTRRVGAESKTDDRRSGMGIAFSIWSGILLAYILARVAPRGDIPRYPVLFFVVGIALMLTGVAFRWYSVAVLGKYFSFDLAIQPGQTVIQRGPYRLIRHPSYSGALITMFGLGLVFTNWFSLLGLLAAGFAGYGYRVMVEEQILLAALGDSYREYMQHTKRFIPFVF